MPDGLTLNDAIEAFLKDRTELMQSLRDAVGGPEVALLILRRNTQLAPGPGCRYENWLIDESGYALAYLRETVTPDQMKLEHAIYTAPRPEPLLDPEPLTEERILN